MKYTVDTLKRVSGSADNDHLVASDFCKEALAEATSRATTIEQICDLQVILDSQALGQAADALAGIRHLAVSAEAIAEFHHNGNLGEAFGNLHATLVNIREKAEAHYRWLCMLFPCPALSRANV